MTTLQLPAPVLEGPAWLVKRKADAWTRFDADGVPDRKHERWRNSDAAAMLEPAAGPADDTGAPDLGLPRLVLIDGRWDGTDPGVDGLRVLPIASDDEVARVHFDHERDDRDAFLDLNTACFEGGLLLDVTPNAAVGPLHIVHVATGRRPITFPRLLVHAQDGSTVTFIEHHIGPGTTAAVTELHAHPGACIRRDLLQRSTGHHIHNLHIRQEQNSTVTDVAVHAGPLRGRSTVVGHLLGAGAHLDLLGLYAADGEQRTDHWTRIDHAVPDTTSREVYKGVLAGRSRGGFTGNVLVRPDAQRTSAEQENRNLLLSDKALAASTPQLEIHADDVRCSHGSTVGQLDEDALFFLQARGIPAASARVVLTKAFAGEIVEALATPEARSEVTAHIEAWFNARRSVAT